MFGRALARVNAASTRAFRTGAGARGTWGVHVAATQAGAMRKWASSAAPSEQGSAVAQDLNEAHAERSAAAAKISATMSEILARSIKIDGPMSVASYMRAALLDPALGYYAASHAGPHDKERHVIGARGDFVTSPEITQVFGEMFGIYFVSHYGDVMRKLPPGSVVPIRLIEFGPGRGTLLQDLLRTFERFPQVSSSLQVIHLVEASEGMRRMQLKAIEAVAGKLGRKIVPVQPGEVAPLYEPGTLQVQWFDSIHTVPVQGTRYTMLMAHEFFDALPIHVFQKTTDGFCEVMINVKDPSKKGGVTTHKASDFIKAQAEDKVQDQVQHQDGTQGGEKQKQKIEFEYVLSPGPTAWSQMLASRNPRFQSMQPGQQVEISPDAWAAARKVGELVAGREAPLPPIPKDDGKDVYSKEIKALLLSDEERRAAARAASSLGGVGAIIDYGDEKSFPHSFRAFKEHEIVDPLKDPGTADLTANVDFLHVKHAIDMTDGTSRPAHTMCLTAGLY